MSPPPTERDVLARHAAIHGWAAHAQPRAPHRRAATVLLLTHPQRGEVEAEFGPGGALSWWAADPDPTHTLHGARGTRERFTRLLAHLANRPHESPPRSRGTQ